LGPCGWPRPHSQQGSNEDAPSDGTAQERGQATDVAALAQVRTDLWTYHADVAFFTSPDGVRLHYEKEGEGPPVVFHLGAGCDVNLWRVAGYVEPLSQHFTCVLFDHRGHGKSDHPASAEANHLDRYTDDVLALIAHLGYERVTFFGWSNGVTVGLRVAEMQPDRFASLVLIGPIAERRSTDQLRAEVASRVQQLRDQGWWLLLDQMLPAEPKPVPQWMIDRILITDIAPYIGWTEARPTWNWSPWDALANIDAPTIMLVGELEDPDDVMGRAASLMPDGVRTRIPEREHINAFLASDVVVPEVTAFLLRHAGAA
jgi:pimeloyl-ACP methyl ester carboxylesterase